MSEGWLNKLVMVPNDRRFFGKVATFGNGILRGGIFQSVALREEGEIAERRGKPHYFTQGDQKFLFKQAPMPGGLVVWPMDCRAPIGLSHMRLNFRILKH